MRRVGTQEVKGASQGRFKIARGKAPAKGLEEGREFNPWLGKPL